MMRVLVVSMLLLTGCVGSEPTRPNVDEERAKLAEGARALRAERARRQAAYEAWVSKQEAYRRAEQAAWEKSFGR